MLTLLDFDLKSRLSLLGIVFDESPTFPKKSLKREPMSH